MKRMTRRGGFAAGALLGTVALALVAMTGAGTAAQQEAPANATQPTIQGSPTLGSTLTATQGTWSGNPTSFTFQWVRCPSTGGLPDGSDWAAGGGGGNHA